MLASLHLALTDTHEHIRIGPLHVLGVCWREDLFVSWAPRTTRLIFRPTGMLPVRIDIRFSPFAVPTAAIAIAIAMAVRSSSLSSSSSSSPSRTPQMLQRDRGKTPGRNGLVWPIAPVPRSVDATLLPIERARLEENAPIPPPTPINVVLTKTTDLSTGSTRQSQRQCQSVHR
jgi:hypothetical protein